MARFERTAFVPDVGQRKETAILLVGTAKEAGIDPRSIKMVQGGFWITEELADLVFEDGGAEAQTEEVQTAQDPEPEEKPKPKAKSSKKKASGDRAAKNTDKSDTGKE